MHYLYHIFRRRSMHSHDMTFLITKLRFYRNTEVFIDVEMRKLIQDQ